MPAIVFLPVVPVIYSKIAFRFWTVKRFANELMNLAEPSPSVFGVKANAKVSAFRCLRVKQLAGLVSGVAVRDYPSAVAYVVSAFKADNVAPLFLS